MAELSNEEANKRLEAYQKLSKEINDINQQLEEGNKIQSKSYKLAELLSDSTSKTLKKSSERNKLESQIFLAQREIRKNSTEIEKIEAKKLGLSKQQQRVLDSKIGKLKLENIEHNQIVEDAQNALDLYKDQETLLEKIKGQMDKLVEKTKLLTFDDLVNQVINLDTQIVDFQKSLLLSREEATNLRSEFASIAASTGDTFITTNKLIAANSALSKQLGFSKVFSEDINTEFVNLSKRVGLTEEAAGGFAKSSIITGRSVKDIATSSAGIVSSVSSQYGIQLNIRDVMEEAGNSSSLMLANFEGSADALVEGVSRMRTLGTNLELVNSQADKLMDFEGTINNQLQASLILGREINLQRAQQLALDNDLVGVAEELTNQAMDYNSFQDLNRIQRQSLAQALGLTTEQLADQLLKLELQGKSLSQIRELNGEAAYERAQELNAQEKLNAAIEKMSDIFVKLVEGPLGTLANIIGRLAENSWVVYGALIAIAGIKLLGVISQMQKLLAIETLSSFIKNPIGATVGLGLGAIALNTAGMLISNFSTKDDLISGYGDRTLITPKGAYALNNNDTVIAGTNLFRGNDVYSGPEGSLQLIDYDRLGEVIGKKMANLQVVAKVSDIVDRSHTSMSLKQNANMRIVS